MAIGLGILRAAGRRRAGPVKNDREHERSTVREVCLIGLDRRGSAGHWAAGQEVTWLGRKYQVVATAADAPGPMAACASGGDVRSNSAMARQYVHLTSCVGD
jgi:hypothetical protein